MNTEHDIVTNNYDVALFKEMQEAGLLSDAEIAEFSLKTVIVADEATVQAVIKDIDEQDAREAVYAEQSAEINVVSMSDTSKAVMTLNAVDADEVMESISVKFIKVEKMKKTRASRKVPVSNLDALKSMFVNMIHLNAELELTPEELLGQVKAIKVQEKLMNFISNRHSSGNALSVYTRIALETLRNDKKLNASTLADVYMKQGNGSKLYSIGTARSQSQQMTTLLKVLHMVKVDGNMLVVDEDSIYCKTLGLV